MSNSMPIRKAFEASAAPDYWIAVWAAYYDDIELALDALDRSPDGWAMWTPVMSAVRQSPRFKSLVREHGLVAYWKEFGWGEFCRPLGDDFICT